MVDAYGQVRPGVPRCWVRSNEYETVEPKSIAQQGLEWVYVVKTDAQRCDDGPKKCTVAQERPLIEREYKIG
jgi:hypothetical protein